MVSVNFFHFLGNVKKGTGLSYITHDYSKNYARKVDKIVEQFARAAESNSEILTVARKCIVCFLFFFLDFSPLLLGMYPTPRSVGTFLQHPNRGSSPTFNAFWS